MTILLTGDWSEFGKDDYIRKFEVYCMEWPPEINLDALSLTTAPFGGLIALMRDRKKIVKVQGSGKPVISIYLASGVFVSSLVWDSGNVVEMGWSSTSELLCVREDGSVLMYDMYAQFLHKFGMGQEAQDTKVVEAKIFYTAAGTGVAILTTANRVFLTNSIKNVVTRKLPELPGVHNTPSAWAVVCGERHSRVLFAKGKEFYSLNDGESQPFPLVVDFGEENYTIKFIAVSSNNEMLALLTERGKLWLGLVDGLKMMRLTTTSPPSPDCRSPIQMVWCGVDGVVINWGVEVDVVGLSPESFHRYSYTDSVYCVQEVDSARVVSFHAMDIIQRVPPSVKDVLSINSTAPGSYLFEASKHYQRKSHRANEYLHLAKPKIFEAVTQCIDAAGHQFNPEIQKMLMRAAQFGKIYLDGFSPEDYVTMIRVLRCLNAVRHPKVGLPLTYGQLKSLSMQGLMETLMIRRNHFLALDLAGFLKMPNSSKIQLHWACYKVEHSRQDFDVIAKEIANKIGSPKDVSYRDIALKAINCGKKDLAVKLIEYEPRADLQIPLLLKLDKDTIALKKSIESGNTDLVYIVLDHMGKYMAKVDFQMEIRGYGLAQALYLRHCRRLQNRQILRDVYTQEDAHKNLAELAIEESFDRKNSGMMDSYLVSAQESYKKAKLEVMAALCEEQCKLNKHQRKLEEKHGREFYGKSLQETIKMLLSMKEIKLADKMRSEYKVPDRRYWWTRIEVIGELEDWAELERFSKLKKPPIGFEPFVDICLKYGRKHEASKYLGRVKDELKVNYLIKMGLFQEAAQTAFEQRDLESLKLLRSKVDSDFAEKLSGYIKQLSK